jgi:zinc D-Ala-D-Ala carboxypeptidase
MNIDWTDGTAKISEHFTVKEACYLPSWQVMHIPSDEDKENILKQASKMDLIRDFLGVPINVHCWIRPILNNPDSPHHGEDYNALVKGAKNSSHKIGLATDYNAQGLNCDDVRSKLESKLDEWQIRMEKMPGGNWVHNDCAEVISNRYFIP